LIGWIGSRAQASRLVPLIAVNGLLILLLVNLPSLSMAIILILLAGIPIVGSSVGVGTLLQRHVADRYRGRVFGALGTSMAIFTFLGQGLATVLGDQLGAVTMLTFKGLLDIAAGLLAIILFYNLNLAQANLEMDRSLSE
jgi:hypothetical protein